MEGEMGVLSIQFENTVKNNDVDSSKKRNDCPIITLAQCPYKFYCPAPNDPSTRV